MSELLLDQIALLEAGDAALREQIDSWAAAHGLQVCSLDPGALLPDENEPALVLLAPGLQRPVAQARQLRSRWKATQLLFLSDEAGVDSLHRELGPAPLLGPHWSIVTLGASALAQLDQALASVRRRSRLRTTLAQANAMVDGGQLSKRSSLTAELYLHHFIDAARDAIVGLDRAGAVLYWSAGAAEMFGLGRGEVLRRAASGLPFWSDELGQALAQVQDCDTTLTLQHEDAANGRTLEIVVAAVCSADGAVVGAALTLRDVSALVAERRANELHGRQLSEERAHLQRLFDQAPGFIAITEGPQHELKIANRAFHQLVGARELLGRPALKAFPQLESRALSDLLQQVYVTGRPYIGRDIAVRVRPQAGGKAERHYVNFIFQPVFSEDEQVSGIFCQGHDVTAQVLAQQALQRSSEQLQELVEERTRELELSRQALYQSQKLEAIGKLTGGVAHDFNNVLQVIAGNLQLLQPLVEANRGAAKRVDAASSAVERGAKLARQLLAFARRQPLRPQPTNLSRLLRDLDELLRQALGERIEIETVVAGGLWTTMVDPNQLEQVVLNLAINARDAMPDGGKLTLELGNAMLDEHYTGTQIDVAPGQYVLLAVSDTGVGMPANIIEQAFEPFFTTKPEGQGTGLGLSMAYGFAKQSGGHIRLYSEPGAGTSVKLYLPRTEQPEVQAQPSTVGPVVGGSETILVVEDDLPVQATVIELLTGLGYSVLRANDAQSALSILQSGLSIDLLFTDVVMPGPLSSTELARQARVLLPDIAVLFTSGYTRNAIVHGGRLDPGVELLSKPYRQEDLARKVRQLLGTQHSDDKPVEQQWVMVVEDQPQLLVLACEMVEELGYRACGYPNAEAAAQGLHEQRFDHLLLDVNLPGRSGPDFAAEALRTQPWLRLVFVSGEGRIESNLPARSLPKPFSFDQLAEILQG
ncbi:response regulator [Stutzerimonas kunmingensis]|uniref:response regulator n=1 Tax=Stutzerimonas kunmingensis TaxID=1211807 RepID=UPI00241D9735|nr:response regulator [Stutzerimonas kunmingensis]